MILDELRNSRHHPTASELYQLVRKRLPRISMGTIYRNLETLTQQGMIRKLIQSGSGARYDADLSRHYHIRCTGCGRLDDVEIESSVLDEFSFSPPSGYEVFGHHLEFIGQCRECRRDGVTIERGGLVTNRDDEQRGMQAGDSR